MQGHCFVVISNMEDATSGVEDVEDGLTEANVKIFPNPATDYVTVEGNDVKSIEVYSLAGALVAVEKGEATLNVSNLAKGTYLVKVATGDGVKVEKMIKKYSGLKYTIIIKELRLQLLYYYLVVSV